MFSQSIICSFSLLLAIGNSLLATTYGKYFESNSTYDEIGIKWYPMFYVPHRNDELKLESPKVSPRTVERIQPDPFLPVGGSRYKIDEFKTYPSLFAMNATECDDESCSTDKSLNIGNSLMSKDSTNESQASPFPASVPSEKVITEFNLTNKAKVQHHSYVKSLDVGSGIEAIRQKVEELLAKESKLGIKSTMKCKICKLPISYLGDKLLNLREGDSESYFVTERTEGTEDQMNENSDQMLIEESPERQSSKQDTAWGSGRNYFVRSRIQEMFVDPKFEVYKSIKEYIFPKPHCNMIRSINLHNANETIRNSCVQNFLRTLVNQTNRNSSLATKTGVDDTNTSIASVMTRCSEETTAAKVNLSDGTVGTEMKTEGKGASVIMKHKEELEPNTTVIRPMNFPTHGDVSDDKSSSGRVTTVLNNEAVLVDKTYLQYGNSIQRVGNISSHLHTPATKLEDKINNTVGTVKPLSDNKLTVSAMNHVDDSNSTMGVQITADNVGSKMVESDKQRVGIVMDDANNNPSVKPETSRLIPEDESSVGKLPVDKDQYSNTNELVNLFKGGKLTENAGAFIGNTNIARNIRPISHLGTDDIVEFLSRLKSKRNYQKGAH